MSTAVQPQHIAVNGAPIRNRNFQMGVWIAIGIVLGPALIAGGYYALWEVHWTFGGLGIDWSLNNWWHDSAFPWFPRTVWPLYRHAAFRDLLEPAAATMFVKTILAKPKFWSLRAGPARLVLTPPLLLAGAIALGCLGVWLLDFVAPAAWHSLFGDYRLTAWGPFQTFLADSSWEILLWGVAMGLVLQRFWAPCGATIQGYWVDRAVDRVQLAEREQARSAGSSVRAALTMTVKLPLWVRYPVAPPVVRERFAWLWDRNAVIKQRGTTSKWLIVVITLIVVLLTALGLLARYYIAKGHHVPYLAP